MAKLGKGVLTKEELEQVPENLRELYVEKDGKFVLDIENVDDLPQVGGLKSALQKERDNVKKLKGDLQATIDKYKDIDPDKAREAAKKLAELEDKQLLDAGKVDDVVAKRTERMQADHQTQIQKFQEKLTTTETELNQTRSTLAQVQIERAITTVIISKTGEALGVVPQAIPDIQRRAREIFQPDSKTGAIIPRRADGSIIYGKDPTQPMSMEEWLTSLRPDCPHYFKTSGGAGGGSNDGGGTAIPKKKRSEMSQAEKAAFIGKHGQDEFFKLPA